MIPVTERMFYYGDFALAKKLEIEKASTEKTGGENAIVLVCQETGIHWKVDIADASKVLRYAARQGITIGDALDALELERNIQAISLIPGHGVDVVSMMEQNSVPEGLYEAMLRYPIVRPIPPEYKGNSFNVYAAALICMNVERGLETGEAAALANLSPNVVGTWEGRLAETYPDSAFTDFAFNIQRARATFEMGNLQRIARAGEESAFWTANAWLLERTKPSRYGRRVEVKDNKAVTVRFEWGNSGEGGMGPPMHKTLTDNSDVIDGDVVGEDDSDADVILVSKDGEDGTWEPS